MISGKRKDAPENSAAKTALKKTWNAVKIPLLPMMIYYFGLVFTITLSALIVVFSVLNGRVVEYLVGSEMNTPEERNIEEIEK
jgi:hypothetical protein